MTMTRKEFLRTLVGAGVGVAGVAAIASCGGDDGGTPDAAAKMCTAAPGATIQANHGHVIMVSLADVQAGADKSYDITGTAAHSHSVMVTAANFASIATGGTVNVTSTTGGGHTHTVTVMCA